MSTVPWMLVEWQKRIEAESHQQEVGGPTLKALRSLKALLTGGAPVDDHLALYFETRGVKLFQSEGMTECSGSLFTGHPTDTSYLTLRMHPSIIYEWIVLPGYEELLGSAEGGELVIVDSPAVTREGYLNNPAANERAFFWAPPAPIGEGERQQQRPVRKFRTGDVFKILPDSGGRCVEYVCRVDDVLSLSTGEKMNPIAFEQEVLRLSSIELPSATSAEIRRVQLVKRVCLLGRNMPLAFAVIEPDYAVAEEAYASLAAQHTTSFHEWLAAWLWGGAVSKVNESWSSSCRVHREAVIILSQQDEPLKISRKQLVYRVLAENRFAEEMRQRCNRIQGAPNLAATTPQRPQQQQVNTEIVRAIWECVAEAVAVPVQTFVADESLADQPFAVLGVTSLLANQVAARLSASLGRDIPVDTLYTYPTVSQLSTFLAAGVQDRAHVLTTKASTMRQKEPVAVIGMSNSFPGGAVDLNSYWQLLRNGVDGISEVPPSRWDKQSYFDPDADAQGKMYSTKGGFVEESEYFDHHFFGISIKEATSMDPRQRVEPFLVIPHHYYFS